MNLPECQTIFTNLQLLGLCPTMFVAHSRNHATADKYDVKDLRKLTKSKFGASSLISEARKPKFRV